MGISQTINQMKKWFAIRSDKCEPVEKYVTEPSDSAIEVVMSCASAGPAEADNVMKSIKQIIQGKDTKRASVGLHLLSLLVLGNEAIAQSVATPKWMQRLVNLSEQTAKAFIRQQVTASVAKWAARYMSNPILNANFEWANKKLNTRFQPVAAEIDVAESVSEIADESAVKNIASVKKSTAGVRGADPGDKLSTIPELTTTNVAVDNSKLSDSIEKIRRSIKSAIETTDWTDVPGKGNPHLVRRGSFSSLNPGSPQVNGGSAIIDEQLGRMDFLSRCLQQVPSLMALNDITLDDIHNPNAASSMEELAEDIEILENFQADVKAIADWNILNKDNDEHLILLQCSYLFSETIILWRKKLSGADTGQT